MDLPGSLTSFGSANPGKACGEELPVVVLGTFNWASFWMVGPLLFSEGEGEFILTVTS